MHWSAYSAQRNLVYGLFWIGSQRLSSQPMKTKITMNHAPTQGLSDGNLKSDLSLYTASAEAVFMKNQAFFDWVWTKGQLAFEDQL